MDVLLASTNTGKLERFGRLLQYVDERIALKTPDELGVTPIAIEETGKTLAENAELKVRAYAGHVDIPILANDTGFYVEGEGFIDTPKRTAVGVGIDTLTEREVAERMLAYWKRIATKHGGRVDAASLEAFAVLYPDGTLKTADSRREWILTDTEYAPLYMAMPARALYISKTTGKPAILHTEEEELIEMEPVLSALRSVLR